MLVPLHSQLPAGDQRAAFAQPPVGLRKVHLTEGCIPLFLWFEQLYFWY